MKRMLLTSTAVVLAVVFTGCVNPDGSQDRTGSGALAGGAIGATSGALIGGSRGKGGEGALIGAAIGAITGGLIGRQMDYDAQARLRTQAPQTYTRVDQGQVLGLADIKALAQAKISDDIIISQIRNSRSVYHLSTADIIDLNNSGVSSKVIDFMINTPNTLGGGAAASPQVQTVYVQSPPPPPRVETVVVSPGPGYVWVGGEWVWNTGWVWVGGHWAYPPRPRSMWVSSVWVHHGSRGWCRTPGHWR